MALLKPGASLHHPHHVLVQEHSRLSAQLVVHHKQVRPLAVGGCRLIFETISLTGYVL